jgi:hypothetical protein
MNITHSVPDAVSEEPRKWGGQSQCCRCEPLGFRWINEPVDVSFEKTSLGVSSARTRRRRDANLVSQRKQRRSELPAETASQSQVKISPEVDHE